MKGIKLYAVLTVVLLIGIGIGFGVTKLVDRPQAQTVSQADTAANKQSIEDAQIAVSAQILSSLREKKGSEFDKAFLNTLMSHDQTAIAMAGLAEQQSERSEVKRWAKYVNDAQISDINQMKTWYNDWGFLREDQENNPHVH